MSRKDQVTYNTFIKAVHELKEEGISPSVRLIRSKIGGSNSTLLDYLRKWQGETNLAATVEGTLSDSIKEALLAEFGRLSKTMREGLQAEVEQEKQHAKEAHAFLLEAEKHIEEREAQWLLESEKASNTILNLEKQLAASGERAAELQRQAEKQMMKTDKQVEALQEKIDQLQQAIQQAEIKAAIAETKASTPEKPSH